MPAATPIWNIPSAMDADPRGLYPTTSQDLADRLEEVLEERVSTHYADAHLFGITQALPESVPTMVALGGSPAVAGDITYNGSDTFTYTGTPRAFVIGCGVGVIGVGDGWLVTLELLVDGTVVAVVNEVGSLVVSAALCVPGMLYPGQTIAMRVNVGAASCEVRDPSLRLIAV